MAGRGAARDPLDLARALRPAGPSRIGDITIRPLAAGDDMQELTDLLHRAYAELAAMGLRYLATHQDVETTKERALLGECYVAERAGVLVGTIAFAPAALTGGSPWYDRPEIASFGQFGVDPALRRLGIGSALLDLVEQRAAATGAAELALDTADDANHLIGLYQRRGYRFIEHVDWRPHTNYCSVVLSKTLR